MREKKGCMVIRRAVCRFKCQISALEGGRKKEREETRRLFGHGPGVGELFSSFLVYIDSIWVTNTTIIIYTIFPFPRLLLWIPRILLKAPLLYDLLYVLNNKCLDDRKSIVLQYHLLFFFIKEHDLWLDFVFTLFFVLCFFSFVCSTIFRICNFGFDMCVELSLVNEVYICGDKYG